MQEQTRMSQLHDSSSLFQYKCTSGLPELEKNRDDRSCSSYDSTEEIDILKEIESRTDFYKMITCDLDYYIPLLERNALRRVCDKFDLKIERTKGKPLKITFIAREGDMPTSVCFFGDDSEDNEKDTYDEFKRQVEMYLSRKKNITLEDGPKREHLESSFANPDFIVDKGGEDISYNTPASTVNKVDINVPNASNVSDDFHNVMPYQDISMPVQSQPDFSNLNISKNISLVESRLLGQNQSPRKNTASERKTPHEQSTSTSSSTSSDIPDLNKFLRNVKVSILKKILVAVEQYSSNRVDETDSIYYNDLPEALNNIQCPEILKDEYEKLVFDIEYMTDTYPPYRTPIGEEQLALRKELYKILSSKTLNQQQEKRILQFLQKNSEERDIVPLVEHLLDTYERSIVKTHRIDINALYREYVRNGFIV